MKSVLIIIAITTFSFGMLGSSFAFSEAGTEAIVTGPGPGEAPQVKAFDTQENTIEPWDLMAYAETYRGGVRVATGDIDADGVDEIITGTGENGGPHLRVFEQDGTLRGIEFFPFHPNFRGGMDVAAGDIDGDGKDEIAVSQFSNGQAWVKIYRYNDERTILYEKNMFGDVECGATVAMGDIDADGRDELLIGAGTGGGPRVLFVEQHYKMGEPYNITQSGFGFYAFAMSSRTGVDVAAGDLDADGIDEFVVSQLKNGQAWVKTYEYQGAEDGAANLVLGNWNSYGAPEVGANVSTVDIDGDGAKEVLTGAGDGGGPNVRSYEIGGTYTGTGWFAYDEAFRGGVDIAGGEF